MDLAQQVCSLELAKQLKALGVKQDSCFYWGSNNDVFQPMEPDTNKYVVCSAFTVAELGEMLPNHLEQDGYWFLSEIRTESNKWDVAYTNRTDTTRLFNVNESNEANARAKALIYLIENNLLPVPPDK